MRHHLYVPRDKTTGERDDSFEQRLSELERWFADPIWKTLENDFVDLGWPQLRKLISLIVSVMYLRTPLHYEYVKGFHRSLVDAVKEAGETPTSLIVQGQEYSLDPSSWPEYRDASEDDLKRMWIEQMGHATDYAKELMTMRWSIIYAEAPTFITSDNPVAILHPSLRFKGFSDPKSLVQFPISPTRVLIMDHQHDQPPHQYYPLLGKGTAQNLLIWRNSIEYMFAHQHTDEVCRIMLEESDSLGNV